MDTGPLTGLKNKTSDTFDMVYYYTANPTVMPGKLADIYNLKTGNNRQAGQDTWFMLIA